MPDHIKEKLLEDIADNLAAIRARLTERNQIELARLRFEFLTREDPFGLVGETLRREFPAYSVFRKSE
jgi:hypothetical protein